jgi:hypothetical protein
MDKEEARAVGERVLAGYRGETYEALQRLIREPVTHEVVGASGVTYQVEIDALWDDEQGGHLRVMAAVDDFTWRYLLAPLGGMDFIITPDGTFIGED